MLAFTPCSRDGGVHEQAAAPAAPAPPALAPETENCVFLLLCCSIPSGKFSFAPSPKYCNAYASYALAASYWLLNTPRYFCFRPMYITDRHLPPRVMHTPLKHSLWHQRKPLYEPTRDVRHPNDKKQIHQRIDKVFSIFLIYSRDQITVRLYNTDR